MSEIIINKAKINEQLENIAKSSKESKVDILTQEQLDNLLCYSIGTPLSRDDNEDCEYSQLYKNYLAIKNGLPSDINVPNSILGELHKIEETPLTQNEINKYIKRVLDFYAEENE
jgi:hypothetical protein